MVKRGPVIASSAELRGTGSDVVAVLDPGEHPTENNKLKSTRMILNRSANGAKCNRAYVDGKPVDVIRVNYNLRGVAVPQGNALG